MRLAFLCIAGLTLASLTMAQPTKGPDGGPHLPSQASADVLREQAGSDAAFIPARSLSGPYDPTNLASMLSFPADDIVVVRLTGRQIRAALERSISLFPQPNSSFLQLSGIVAEFSPAGSPESRILNVTVSGAPLDENRVYTVAMPGSLGRGGSGYFKIWDKSKIERTLPGVTLESMLKKRRYVASSPRWVARP